MVMLGPKKKPRTLGNPYLVKDEPTGKNDAFLEMLKMVRSPNSASLENHRKAQEAIERMHSPNEDASDFTMRKLVP